MLTRQEIFSLVNVANIKSSFLNDNFVNSVESFHKFFDESKGIPLLVPANEKLFEFSAKNVFSLSKEGLVKTIYGISDESYIGFKHAFNQFTFLDNFIVKKDYQAYVERMVQHNKNIMAELNLLKENSGHIGAFQTRNVPHYGHEKIIQRLLEFCDHVVINPVIGPKKRGDSTIKFLTEVYAYLSRTKYQEKISFKPIFANMFYAGPREAMHHAIIRERLGFNYFTVGRDHAGAENIYNPNMASELIERNRSSLAINVMAHNGAAFCPICNEVIIIGDCSHSYEQMVDISGSDFRLKIKENIFFELADPQMQRYIKKIKGTLFER